MDSQHGTLSLEQSSGVNVYSNVVSSARLQTDIGSKPEQFESPHQVGIRVHGLERGSSCASSLPSTVLAGVVSRSGSGNQGQPASVATTPIVSQHTAAGPRATRGVSNSPAHALASGLPRGAAIEAGHCPSSSTGGSADSIACGPAEDAQTGSTVNSYFPRPHGDMLRTHSDTSHETGSGTVSGANDVACAFATLGGEGGDARAVCGGTRAGRDGLSSGARTDEAAGCSGVRGTSASTAEAAVGDSHPSCEQRDAGPVIAAASSYSPVVAGGSAAPSHPQIATGYTALGIDSGAQPDHVSSTFAGLPLTPARPPAMPRRPPPASGAGAADPQEGPIAGNMQAARASGATARTGGGIRRGAVDELDFSDDEDTSDEDDEYVPATQGRQPAFEAAKRRVALYPHEQQERRDELEKIGRQFHADVCRALDGFPEVEMVLRGIDPVGFTKDDIAAIERSTGLEPADVGGRAGGIKFRHKGMGLFLKFAFDQAGIYNSTRMAAKAAKREAAASRWVHAMDSVHVSTPLLECVDLPVKLTRDRGSRVIRAQVFAHIAISAATLRVGSSDGCKTVHTDDEQLNDVVKPLAHWFGIKSYDRNITALVRHSYVEQDPADFEHIFQYLGQTAMDTDVLSRIKEKCDPSRMRVSEEDKQKLNKKELQLAETVYRAVHESGLNLDYRTPQPIIQHTEEYLPARDTSGGGTRGRLESHQLHLPFDVEVHQLDTGQRMVLDTHRLLIPDVLWMDWMKSDEAKPRVWGIVGANTDSATVYQFKLPDMAHGSDGRPDLAILSRTLEGRAAPQMALLSSAETASFPDSQMEFDADLGCVLVRRLHPDGSPVLTAIISCPRWYYCGNAALTCMLPPEAGRHMGELEGSEWPGLCPDRIMHARDGSDPEIDRAKRSISQLYDKAVEEGVQSLKIAMHKEQDQRGGASLMTDPVAFRRVLKATMHSFGLGLRHSRLLLESTDIDDVTRMAVTGALLTSMRLRSKALQPPWHHVLASATMHATKGILCPASSSSSKAFGTASTIAVAAQCAGISLAVPAGIHTLGRGTAAEVMVQEVAHVLRVGGSGVGTLLVGLDSLCTYSSGLGPLRIALIVKRQTGQMREHLPACRIDQVVSAQLECASALTSLADLFESQGKYGEAMELYRQCLQIQEHAVGKSHPDYANALSNMAYCFQSQGKYGDAMELHRQCLQIREHALGNAHPESASTLNSMAQCLWSQGKYGDAMELHRQCLQIQEDAVGKSHPDCAKTLSSMAYCLWSQGKYGDAMELHRQCLQIQEDALGKSHPDCAKTLSSMADCLQSQGKYGDAMKLHRQCLQIQEHAVGKSHPGNAQTLNNMANCLQSQGKYGDAMQLFRQCLQIQERALGKSHPDYANVLNSMAYCLQSQGKYGDAMELHRQCLQIQEDALGKSHPDYANALTNMAYCLQSQGKYGDAMELHRQCLQIQEDAVGKSHPDYANALSNLAYCLQSQGKYGDAMELHRQCLQIQEDAVGKSHPDYAKTLTNMAICSGYQGNCRHAMELFRQSMQIQENTVGKSHPDYANTLTNIAICLQQYGQFGYAMELFRKSMKIMEDALGKSHPSYARTLAFLADCLRSQGMHMDAMELYRQCLQIYEDALGKSHRYYTITLNGMAYCLWSQGKYEGAMELYRQCLQIQEDALGKSHPDYAKTLEMMAQCSQAGSCHVS